MHDLEARMVRRLGTHRLGAGVVTLGLLLGTATVAPQGAVAAAAPKSTAAADARTILTEGIKAPDFVARGMAYEALALDKKIGDIKTMLKDGEEDPQWVVRAGIARAYMRLKDPSWKRVVGDAISRATLDPREVLPVLDTLADKDAIAFLLERLADKELDRQDAIVDALVVQAHPRLGAFIVAAIGSKDELVHKAGTRALASLNPVLHGAHLQLIAAKAGKVGEVIGLICDIADKAPTGVDLSYLALLKPGKGEEALADRVTMARARQKDRAVGKAVLAIAARREGDARIEIVEIYAGIASKDDSEAIKALIDEASSPRLKLAVYQVLADLGDRSVVKQAEEMAGGTDTELRPIGVYYLGRIGGAGRIGEMHTYLRDGIPEVRIAAARVLSWIASKISVGPLREALDNESRADIRIEYLKALTSIKDPAAVQALVFYTRETDDDVRRRVVRSLAESGDKAARNGLQTALSDRSKEVRIEAVRGFILSDPANAVQVFQRSLGWLPRGTLIAMTREFGDAFDSYLELALFSKSIEMREEALEALALLPKKQGELLRKVLASADEDELRIRVLLRLFALEGNKVATEVKSAALATSTRVRIEGIRLCGKLKGDKEAKEIIERSMSEADQRVRIAAALTWLGG